MAEMVNNIQALDEGQQRPATTAPGTEAQQNMQQM